MCVPDAAAFETLRQLINRQKLASSGIGVQYGLGCPACNASDEGRRLTGMAHEIYAAPGGKLELVPRTCGGTVAVWASQSGKPVVAAGGGDDPCLEPAVKACY